MLLLEHAFGLLVFGGFDEDCLELLELERGGEPSDSVAVGGAAGTRDPLATAHEVSDNAEGPAADQVVDADGEPL